MTTSTDYYLAHTLKMLRSLQAIMTTRRSTIYTLLLIALRSL